MLHWRNLNRKIWINFKDEVIFDSVVPHTMITAGSGHGKDMFGEGLITKKIGKYKVIDFYSESRAEGFFYGIENDDPYFLKIMKNLSNNTIKPKAFKSEIYMILGKKILFQNTYPKNIKIVTLDERDFKGEPVIEFLGGNSNPSREVLTMMFWVLREKYGIKEPTISDIEDEIKRIRADLKNKKSDQIYILENYQQIHYMTVGNIFRNIIKIRESGIFENNAEFEKLSIKEVMSNPDVITTFSLELLENDMQKALALGMIAKKLVDFKKEDKELSKVLVYMREMQKFYEPREDGVDKYFSLLKNSIYYILTEGRDTGLILYGNAQDFFEQIPSYVRVHFQQLVVGRQSRKSAERLKEYGNISPEIIDKIPSLDKGVFLVMAMGKYFYPVFSIPTQHKKKEAGYNVMAHLTIMHGGRTWKNEGLFSDDSYFNNTQDSTINSRVVSPTLNVFQDILSSYSSTLPPRKTKEKS